MYTSALSVQPIISAVLGPSCCHFVVTLAPRRTESALVRTAPREDAEHGDRPGAGVPNEPDPPTTDAEPTPGHSRDRPTGGAKYESDGLHWPQSDGLMWPHPTGLVVLGKVAHRRAPEGPEPEARGPQRARRTRSTPWEAICGPGHRRSRR